jgi:hypothetical protein
MSMQRRCTRGLAAALVVASALGAGALLGACAGDGAAESDDGASTTGARVQLATTIAPGPLAFTNDEGWSIEVRRALVSIGALHYFSGEPIEGAEEARLERRPPGGALGWLLAPLAIREAHAHPGHYAEGDARGEMLAPTSVDLAAGPIAIGGGDGVTGEVRSARFTWGAPAEGPFASDLGDAVVLVEGRAERDGAVRFFRLSAAAAELPDADTTVDGCVFDPADVGGDGAVTLTIVPSVWLAGADLEDAPGGDEGAPAEVPGGTQPKNAFLRGLAKGGAFHFRFDPA